MTAMAIPADLKLVVNFNSEEDLHKFNAATQGLDNDSDFASRVELAETTEEYFAAAKEYVDCTYEDFKNVYDSIVTQAAEAITRFCAERELAEAELDLVVGGGFWDGPWSWIKENAVDLCRLAVKTIITGVCVGVGAAIGTAAGGVGGAVGGAVGGVVGAYIAGKVDKLFD